MSEQSARLLTVAQVSDRLRAIDGKGLQRTQIVEYIERGELKATKFGPNWAVTEEALADFMAKPRYLGPKSKLREDRTLRKLERLLEQPGMTVSNAMKAIGVSQDRYYRECAANAEFKARMEAARERGREQQTSRTGTGG